MCTGYHLCHPGCPKMFCPLWPLWPRDVSQVTGSCCTTARCTQCENLVATGQLFAEIMQILAFSTMPQQLSKVGQGDLVFGVQGLFTSMSLCARFQVSLYSGYDLWHRLMSQTIRPTDLRTDGFCTEYMNSSAGWLASWAKSVFIKACSACK